MKRLVIAVLCLVAVHVEAEAGAPRMAPRGAESGPPGGIGCYWYRGRSHCGRYCYIEVDGARYCTERLRDAHSQAPALPPLPQFGNAIK